MAYLRKSLKMVSFTPTISTTPYSAGDQVGDLIYLDAVLDDDYGTATLTGFEFADLDSQSMSVQLLFFSDAPTVTSVDNGTVDISDDEMTKFIGFASTNTSLTFNGAQMNGLIGGNLVVFSRSFAKPKGIWCLIRCTTTPTFTTTSSLSFKLFFERGWTVS